MIMSDSMKYSHNIIGINECSTVADCVGGTVCINTAEDPGYLCQCPPGFTGDGRLSGDGCIGEIQQ